MANGSGSGFAALPEAVEPRLLLVQPRSGDVGDVVGFLEASFGGSYTLCVEHDIFYAFRQLRRRRFDAVLLDAELPRVERMAAEFAAARGDHDVIVLDRGSNAPRVKDVA